MLKHIKKSNLYDWLRDRRECGFDHREELGSSAGERLLLFDVCDAIWAQMYIMAFHARFVLRAADVWHQSEQTESTYFDMWRRKGTPVQLSCIVMLFSHYWEDTQFFCEIGAFAESYFLSLLDATSEVSESMATTNFVFV